MRKLILLFPALLTTAVLFLMIGCRKPSPALEVGGIYSINDGKDYGIVKLLVHEDHVCHVRVYKQKFPTRPVSIDVNNLSLGKPGDPDGFGMGHIPMRES